MGYLAIFYRTGFLRLQGNECFSRPESSAAGSVVAFCTWIKMLIHEV